MTKLQNCLSILLGSIAGLALLPTLALAEPERFETPEAAVQAVAAALEARDRDGLLSIFGPENEDLILTGDQEQDRADWGGFLQNYREMHRVAVEDGGKATLFVGDEQWPFPVTLVEAEGGWSFDTAAAAEEIQLRRIGRNELDVIEVMKRYVGVQAQYRLTDHDEDGVMEFASGILSSSGKRDGLYWPSAEGEPESPIGDFVARASAAGFSVGGEVTDPEPYLGYYFRILQSQGENAPGGAMEYHVNGNMVAGHALLAFPADYGESGIMSFMVAENGQVLETDLGEETLEAASAIEAYDPDGNWVDAEE